jgi:hypothetical protein
MTAAQERERMRIEKSFLVFDLTPEQQECILEAMDSAEWEWFKDCDGCTAVSELHWPTKYFPPCVRHDYDWMRGRGDWEASKRFYQLQRAYGAPVWRSGLRALAVTLVWYGGARWRFERKED